MLLENTNYVMRVIVLGALLLVSAVSWAIYDMGDGVVLVTDEYTDEYRRELPALLREVLTRQGFCRGQISQDEGIHAEVRNRIWSCYKGNLDLANKHLAGMLQVDASQYDLEISLPSQNVAAHVNKKNYGWNVEVIHFKPAIDRKPIVRMTLYVDYNDPAIHQIKVPFAYRIIKSPSKIDALIDLHQKNQLGYLQSTKSTDKYTVLSPPRGSIFEDVGSLPGVSANDGQDKKDSDEPEESEE